MYKMMTTRSRREPVVAAWAGALLLLAFQTFAAAEPTSGRKLLQSCHMDNCGIWCGAPRGAPCGLSSGGGGQWSSFGAHSGGYQPPATYDDDSSDSNPGYQPSTPSSSPCYGASGQLYSHGAVGKNDKWQTCTCYDGKWKNCKWESSPSPRDDDSDDDDSSSEKKKSPPPSPKYSSSESSSEEKPPSPHKDDDDDGGYAPGLEVQSSSDGGQHRPPPKSEDDDDSHAAPRAPSSGPPPGNEPGCYGSLPFNLQSCVCDGAAIGEMAGLAACGRMATECLPPVLAFSITDGALEAVQQICDTFALDSCLSASEAMMQANSGCRDILKFGTQQCTPNQAAAIFRASVSQSCTPLCPDCVRFSG